MLTACCTTSGATKAETERVRIVDTACDWTAPLYVSKDDVLTDGTAQAILAHNRAGAKICGWQPRKK